MINNIILIEDRQEFASHFTEEALAKDIRVKHERSLEGLKKIIPKYEHSYAAVVLDIKCLTYDAQEIEDPAFITSAISFLDSDVKGFPRFILTGDDKEFETLGRYYKDEKLFLKTPQDIDKLFVELKLCIDNSEVLQIKRKHNAVFELFEKGYFDANTELTLISILQCLDESSFQAFGGILRDVRALQETIYKVINNKNRLVVPDNKFKPNGMIMFNPLMKHLNGYPNAQFVATRDVYQNSAIFHLANGLYWASGQYIHADPNESYEISNYTLKSLINSLMELFIWSEQYVK